MNHAPNCREHVQRFALNADFKVQRLDGVHILKAREIGHRHLLLIDAGVLAVFYNADDRLDVANLVSQGITCVIVLLPVAEVRIGNGAAFEVGLVLVQRDRLIWLGKGQRAEQHAIDHREQRRVGPDAEGQSDHCDRREAAGAFHQHGNTATNVLQQSFHIQPRTAIRSATP